jgi:hypothetical protein
VIVMTTSNAMEISSEKLTSLLNEVKRIVGEEHVTIYSRDNESNSSGRNVSLFRSKYIQATISPKGNNEIIQIIGLFNNSKVDVKLNIISTGRNWGLGSSVPAQADGVTLDLRRMSAIREINLDEGWAIVEPGVTQLTLGILRTYKLIGQYSRPRCWLTSPENRRSFGARNYLPHRGNHQSWMVAIEQSRHGF